MTTRQSGYLILRLRSYPAWRTTVNGYRVVTIPRDSDGLIDIPVPAGQIAVAVDWTTSPDVIIGRIISVVSLALLAALYFGERKILRID